MRKVTVEGIKDFQVCERFYAYRYEEDQREYITKREIQAQRFENTLKRVASFFFYKKQAEIVPSYNSLLNRWEKLWFPKEMDAYDLVVEQHEAGNIASYSNAAAASLERFHKVFANDKGAPILIDEGFFVPLNKEIRLEGRIDLILKYNDKMRVIKWSGRKHRPGVNSLVLDFAALRLAFEHRNEIKRNVEYGIYDLAQAKSAFEEVEIRRADMDALLYWAAEIHTKETFVPRRGYTAYCKGCAFDESCKAWADWPKL